MFNLPPVYAALPPIDFGGVVGILSFFVLLGCGLWWIVLKRK